MRNLTSLAAKTAAVALPALALAAPAFAAVPEALEDALTAIQTDGVAVQALGWPVFVAIVGGFVLFKLAKKVIGKVT